MIDLIAILAGGIIILGSVFNQDWIFNFGQARVLSERWGRTPARIIYFLLGLILIGIATT